MAFDHSNGAVLPGRDQSFFFFLLQRLTQTDTNQRRCSFNKGNSRKDA